MPNRMISLERNTNETQIDLTLDLDGTGRYEVDTGCGFLNHMLELFARHGRLTWSVPKNSGWALPAACPPRSTLYNLREKIHTTSSRPASRAQAMHWARP